MASLSSSTLLSLSLPDHQEGLRPHLNSVRVGKLLLLASAESITAPSPLSLFSLKKLRSRPLIKELVVKMDAICFDKWMRTLSGKFFISVT